ncbi:hypothetical protein HRR83_001270 [Exophiala dermatitidis]|uniref:Acyltransferase 3 domain-containing protein n=2 Tax=Exophiala dermatitidis TaxID=5970 RepID=H6C6W0_EXODN|nr:uncharacterized protein HMPREF1120_07445 [Exophiala dermatitidis NIH/UT8656]KAJ4522776.1 hypothetical protein HRR75_001170 [Exophiala dermatitidis]EHY59456.1 hypothetical protein HMPREF1120_07445 [Exophiala dermatitidis NIH/UT8656]KAJ4526081.1 hypothetical protein HRR74_001274 [Exophiala dermatitidis]KAJ4526975.1 hypothetical protein HRR73_001772 [Exophiala dermatitidis]KAJ4532689.1 hypothetical protein HRR76_007673 [Exophiala dermatitidis]
MAEYTRLVGSTSPRLSGDYHRDHDHDADAFEHDNLAFHDTELDEKQKPLSTVVIKEGTSASDLDTDPEDNLDVEKQHQQRQEERSSPVPKWKQYKTYSSLMKSWCIAALPTFCQPGGLRRKGQLRPTAWLDALRGYAAWIVFHYHCFNSYSPSWRRQPFISFFWAGPGMVALFFVISGYVLSYSLLKQMRRRQSTAMLESLASSSFRRYIRLYASSVVATMFPLMLVRLRLYNGAGSLHVPTFFGQVGDWLYNNLYFINPFADIRGWYHQGTIDSKYLGTLWTIPVEFRGSMILFGFCAAVCKLTTPWRMGLTWLIIILSYVWNTVFVAEFLFGMFVADVSLSRNPDLVRRQPLPTTHTAPAGTTRDRVDRWVEKSTRRQKALRIARNVGYVLLFILGVFFLGQPDGVDLGVWGNFPWQFLKSFIPPYYGNGSEYYFYLSMGGFFLLLALDSLPILQLPLNWGFSQYVGELSFGIYALHPPLTFAFFRDRMEPWRAKHLGDSPLAFIPGYILMTLLVFITADYFTRLDKKVVKGGRWLQSKLFRTWDD